MSEFDTVLLLSIDCIRHDRCGFNGYDHPTTPFMDRLSEDSYVFDAAYATGPYTPESFPGILAGLHTAQTEYVGDLICKAIPHGTPTIASRFREHGFHTLASLSNPHLSENRNFDRGFDEFENSKVAPGDTMVEWRDSSTTGSGVARLVDLFSDRLRSQQRYPNPYVPLYALHRYRQLDDWPTVDGKRVRERFTEMVEQHADEPLFGWCHFMDAHAPIHPHKEPKVHDVGGALSQLAADGARLANVRHERCSKRYDNGLRYIDEQIELLFDDLDRLGRLDDAVIILVGDHGEALAERDVYDHPWHYMYEELLKVPLLVWTADGVGGGRRRSEPFSLAWLHALLEELTDVDMGDVGSRSPPDPVLGGSSTEPVVADSVSPMGYSIAIRDGTRKFVQSDVDDVDVPYRQHVTGMDDDAVTFDLEAYPDERAFEALDAGGTDLRDVAATYHVAPEDIDQLSPDLDPGPEDRLQELGYLE